MLIVGLFRGRYKAALAVTDNYLLRVSRYIHRSPIGKNISLLVGFIDYKRFSCSNFIKISDAEIAFSRFYMFFESKCVNI